MKNKKFWEFKAKGGTSGELLLYGDISDAQAWWGDGNEITPVDFKADLDALGDITELNVLSTVVAEMYLLVKQFTVF